VHYLSPLSYDRLAHLHTRAAYHRVIGDGERVLGFLLAFAQGADYDSINYRWFASRFDDFLYIDRVVVSPESRGLGLGALLYQDVFTVAAEAGYSRIVCEFDVEPPNPVSAAFHRRFGFAEVGTQLVAGGTKTVSLQSTTLSGSQPGRWTLQGSAYP
jgi:hypothetical protein